MNSATLGNDSSGTKPEFDKLYEYGSEIGKGRYASVKKCFCKKTNQVYAAKIIKNFRTKNTKLNLNIVENEITALTIARPHQSIINLYEVFYHRGETILILEYAEEKDLHIYLDSEGAFEEQQACHIIYQVLKAIEFLHSKQVLHLDIKPENVLLMNPLAPKSSPSSSHIDIDDNEKSTDEDKNENNNNIKKNQKEVETCFTDVKVKLCDFSFSQVMIPGKQILGMMGTVAYSAPEVLQYDALTKATDMWSLGVLAHVLLTEYTPFGNGTEELNQTQTNILNVREDDFECVEEYFDDISVEAKDFIEKLIKFRPRERMTIEQALNHSFIKNYNITEKSLDTIIPIQKTQHIPSNIERRTAEDDKENITQKEKNCITKSTNNSINFLSNNNNNAENLNLNLSINPQKLNNNSKCNIDSNKSANENNMKDIIKDDKNNNIITQHEESSTPSSSSLQNNVK